MSRLGGSVTQRSGNYFAPGYLISSEQAEQSYLQSLSRAPRILWVSDSINNSPYLLPRLKEYFPGIVIERRSYSGSKSPIGLFFSSEPKARITTGQLLPNTDVIGTWTKKESTVSKDYSPSTGRTVTRITTKGVGGQGLSVQSRPAVPAGAPPLTFSFLFEPGTIQSFRVNVVNTTKGGGVVVSVDFPPNEVMDTRGGLLSRYSIPMKPTDGATYSAGDILAIDILLGSQESYKVGTAYIEDPILNVGHIPAPFRPTSGTAETPGTEAWSSTVGGTDRNLFDLAVVTLGRNDTNDTPWKDYEQMVGSIISGLSTRVGRVMFCTPPPQCDTSLQSFVPDDPYQTRGFLEAARRASIRHGAYFYDAISDFRKLVDDGEMSVAELMRDTIHPTDANATSAGIGRYVKAVEDTLKSKAEKRAVSLTTPPNSQIGGEVVSGSWTWKRFTAGTAPLNDAHGFFTGNVKEPNNYVFSSSEVGAKVKYSVKGSLVGLIILNDRTTAGVGKVTIDGVAYPNIVFNAGGTSNYPTGIFIASGLLDIEHEIIIEVASGEVRMIAAVGC